MEGSGREQDPVVVVGRSSFHGLPKKGVIMQLHESKRNPWRREHTFREQEDLYFYKYSRDSRCLRGALP